LHRSRCVSDHLGLGNRTGQTSGAENVLYILAGNGVIAVGDDGFTEHGDSRLEVIDNLLSGALLR